MKSVIVGNINGNDQKHQITQSPGLSFITQILILIFVSDQKKYIYMKSVLVGNVYCNDKNTKLPNDLDLFYQPDMNFYLCK